MSLLEYYMLKESDFVTDWLDEREQKGLQKGLQKGREEGKRSLLLALLAKKFGKLSPTLQKQINQLSGKNLDNLSLAFLNLKNVKELQAWLANGKATPGAN